MGQVNENDQNKNRKYKHIDKRVQETYTRDSKATLRNKLSDPYVKAFRLASDRIRTTGGVVAYVSNNSFIDQIAFDGMRKHLASGLSTIYVIDLGGNVRQNPKLSGTTHNVFGIQVGVAITLLVKHADGKEEQVKKILYARMPEDWRKGQKTTQLEEWRDVASVEWKQLAPDKRGTWLTSDQQSDFGSLMPLGSKTLKSSDTSQAVFRSFSLGVVSARDSYVYNCNKAQLSFAMQASTKAYGEALSKYLGLKPPRMQAGSFIDTANSQAKWSRQTIASLTKLEENRFSESFIRRAIYRPFYSMWHYFDDFWNEERYQMPRIFPLQVPECRTQVICLSQNPVPGRFHVLATDLIADFHLVGDSQCFPFYTYNEDGTNRQENITDWALDLYRTHYADPSITKWDIFHSTYALLHHPEYRTRYAANLKRELPRIPFPPDLHAFAAAGKRLMELHIDYEQQPEYPLEEIEQPKAAWTLRVERMSLSKDRTELRYNEALTLRGIPPAAFDYRLGNRSALEWVIDQYRVSTDARSGIVNDPNRPDDERYILRLIGQVITVSLETLKIVNNLPTLAFLASTS